MKYFIFSIDDGTIYDKQTIKILNKYHLKGTFNLNSGLDDFVWYLNELSIRRLSLQDNIHLYDGHEVASHSLTHPHLTECSGEHIVYEVGQDIFNLENIFNRSIRTFAFPFEDSDERCINVIKHLHNIKVIRLSQIDDSFKMINDLHHVKITSLDVNDALTKLERFIHDDEAELFVFVSHSYDFFVNNTFDKFEELCQKVSKQKDIKVITMGELSDIFTK